MVRALATAMAGLLAVLLSAAGTIKVLRPEYARGALVRVIPSHFSDALLASAAVRVFGTVEIISALALLSTHGQGGIVVAAVVCCLFLVFVVMTHTAIRQGAACGCWGSLSVGKAGNRELLRRVFLAGIAAVLLTFRWQWSLRAPMPFGVATGIVTIAAVTGIAFGTRKSETFAQRLVTATALGTRAGFGEGAGKAVAMWRRRKILGGLRNNPFVRAVILKMEAEQQLNWHQARVTTPRDSRSAASNLVSVPGNGASLRIIVLPNHPPSIIGETTGHLFLSNTHEVRMVAKNSRA